MEEKSNKMNQDTSENSIINNNDISPVTTEKTVISVNSSKSTSYFYDWMHSIIVAIIVVILLLTFVFRLIDVDGQSMEDTLLNHDKVIVTDLLYTPKDGDIIVISHGADYAKPIIKRVIATAGQTLSINFDNGQVVVDGVVLQEDYIKGQTGEGTAEIPSVVPDGKVFVMGDNRTVSMDSRYTAIGLIDENDIIGKAQVIVFPFNDFGYLY